MKRFAFALTLLLTLVGVCVAQGGPQGLYQSFTESINLAPPAIVNSQTASNLTGTGVQVSSTGGSIAAGSYRVCVTLFTASNTETPCSTDTATTSVVTTTGSTSTLIIQSPIASGTGPNVLGWRMYVGASGGASAAESLQTITATICSLSSSTTASCALGSPATFTVSTGFSGSGTAPPSTPGTAIFPAVSNAANQYLFENSTQTYRTLSWIVSGTAPSACTIQIQTGSTVAGLANVGQALTCTSTGGYALPSVTAAAYSSLNLSSYTPGDTTTSVTFYYQTLPFNPVGRYYFGNAAPTGTCLTGALFDNTAGAESTTLYGCNSGTWTAVTIP